MTYKIVCNECRTKKTWVTSGVGLLNAFKETRTLEREREFQADGAVQYRKDDCRGDIVNNISRHKREQKHL